MFEPKRHHYVTRIYLSRFRLDDSVSVRWRSGKACSTGTINVAVKSRFYDITGANGGGSTVVEKDLLQIEGEAMAVLAHVDRDLTLETLMMNEMGVLAH